MIYNALVLDMQQSDSVLYIYAYVYILVQTLLHYRLSQDIEYSFLSYIVGPCCSSTKVIKFKAFLSNWGHHTLPAVTTNTLNQYQFFYQ